MVLGMRGLVLTGLSLVLLLLAPAATAAPTISVLDSPEVVVANPPENMTQDNFNPDYPFSATVRVTNDGDASQVNTEAVMYTDPSVNGCPDDERAFPIHIILKTRELDPNEQIEIGGSADARDGGDAYWPLAISQEYRDATTNESVEIGGAEYGFCANVRVSGQDPSCEKPDQETCVVASDPFRAYVREENAAPEITEFSVPENPDPDQEVLLRADAEDADTEPRPDSLSFTWSGSGIEDTGRTVRHTFPSNGTYDVTVSVTDGFDTVERTAEIAVGAAGDDGGGTDPTPVPAALALAGLLAGALVGRRR